MVVTCAPRHQGELNRWTWRNGGGLPPFAAYLLHLTKIRYQCRVHRSELRFRDRGDALERDVADLVALHEEGQEITPDRWRAARRNLERVRVAAMDLALTGVGLSEMARTVRIAQANARAVLPGGTRGPLGDDQEMTEWFAAQLEDDRVYVEAAVRRAGDIEAITAARIGQWFHEREEEGRRHSDRLTLLQTSVLGALLMSLGAIQAFQYRLPLPGRLYAPLIAVLSALALTLPAVVTWLSQRVPDRPRMGLSGYAGTAAVGGAAGWLAVSLATHVFRLPVQEPGWTVLAALAGTAAATTAAALRARSVRGRRS